MAYIIYHHYQWEPGLLRARRSTSRSTGRSTGRSVSCPSECWTSAARSSGARRVLLLRVLLEHSSNIRLTVLISDLPARCPWLPVGSAALRVVRQFSVVLCSFRSRFAAAIKKRLWRFFDRSEGYSPHCSHCLLRDSLVGRRTFCPIGASDFVLLSFVKSITESNFF